MHTYVVEIFSMIFSAMENKLCDEICSRCDKFDSLSLSLSVTYFFAVYFYVFKQEYIIYNIDHL